MALPALVDKLADKLVEAADSAPVHGNPWLTQVEDSMERLQARDKLPPLPDDWGDPTPESDIGELEIVKSTELVERIEKEVPSTVVGKLRKALYDDPVTQQWRDEAVAWAHSVDPSANQLTWDGKMWRNPDGTPHQFN